MSLFHFIGLVLTIGLGFSCTKKTQTESEVDKAEVLETALNNEVPASVGTQGEDSLNPEAILKEPEEKELVQSLNNDSFFSLTVGSDTDEEFDTQPTNAKLVYYEVENRNEVDANNITETSLDGEAELLLDRGQYYIIEVDYQDQGILKAMVSPDMLVVETSELPVLDIRLNRVSTIAADLFLELVKQKEILALFYSREIKSSTIYHAASEFKSLIKSQVSQSSLATYWKSEMYVDSLSKFSQNLSETLLSVAPYDNEFESKKINEIIAEIEIEAPKINVDLLLKKNSKTACYIKQDVCTRKPHKIGEFKDNYQNSSKDYIRCLRRAAEYHRWCKNDPSDVTIAEFRQDNVVMVSSDSDTPFQGCFISMEACNRFPDRVGQFIDNYKAASTDIDRCMMRAHDYFRSCRNTSDQVVTATYYDKGVMVQHLDSNTPYTGCFVQINACERKPEWVGIRYDNYQKASLDPDRCLQRAHDFHRACRNDNSVKTFAAFYNKGNIIKEIDSQSPYTGCFIQANTCRKHPESVGLYIDNYKKASLDQDRCLKRAAEIHRWCGNAFEEVVNASFYQKGTAQATIDSQTPYSGCFISQTVCQRLPERVGLFLDNYQNASGDPERCMMRAHDYHRSCRNKFDEVVSATFYEKGAAQKTLDSQTPHSGCFVKMEVCKAHPEKEGIFIDNHKNSSYDVNRCMMRAADFHRWCKNSFDETVTAMFYEKGEIKKSIDSKTPYSGCYISQDNCKRRASKKGLFKDNYQNASFDQDRCMKRAVDYHSWCRNSDTQSTTAAFYVEGSLISSNIYTGEEE